MPSATIDPLVTRGRELLGLRRDSEALECFEQALSELPAAPAARIGRCQALMRLGQPDDALALLDQWPTNEPGRPGTDGVRAQILLVKGRTDDAWQAANQGCARDPQDPAALLVRGLLILERGDPSDGLAAFDAAIALDPALASAHQGRGSALVSLGRTEEALGAFGSALRLDPNNAMIAARVGHLMIQTHRLDRALEAFTAALDIDQRSTAALQGRAQCLAALGRAPEAVLAYSRLLDVARDADYMRGEHFHLQMHCCDWREFDTAREDIAARVRRGERADIPGSFMAHTDSPADQLICARTFAADVCPTQARRFSSHPRSEGERIRVAYLSADFCAHATAFLAAGLFEAHDRSRFETYAISFGPDEDSEMRRRLFRAFDHFEDVRPLTDRQIAALVHERGIDIAVDLKGHTLGARPGIFAYRPAPVQVSFLGYPGTLGTDSMDYIVADQTVIPASERIHYAEQVIYMPGSYQVNDSARVASATPTRREAGLPESAFVFCCFNSVYKITPPVFDDWMQILDAVPGSILWLLQGNPAAVENLRSEALRRGIDAQRLVFASWLPAADHLARCALADLFLDTLPCNAHTTASDALWAGVPIVTRAGASFVSRVATSLLCAVGLGRLSVDSREEYRRVAIGIARSPAELKSLKETLALARDRSTLFDSAWYCRQLEAAFEEIVARCRRGETPSPLQLPAMPK
jgi:predicted O-linked N-acetylglucosamine transferase (SPINDLY family)